MDKRALYNLSYGLCVIGAKDRERLVGCTVNTVIQATSDPVTILVCINRENYTNACIKQTGEFSVSILSEKVPESTIGTFGFFSSKDTDKFADVSYALTPSGLPYLTEGVTSYFQCKVIDAIDNHTHTVFIAEVQEAENLSDEPPVTYAYYRTVIKGKTPPKAPSFVAETAVADIASAGTAGAGTALADGAGAGTAEAGKRETYVCSVCRYEYPGSIEEFEQLPDTYACPVCRATKDKFVLKIV